MRYSALEGWGVCLSPTNQHSITSFFAGRQQGSQNGKGCLALLSLIHGYVSNLSLKYQNDQNLIFIFKRLIVKYINKPPFNA